MLAMPGLRSFSVSAAPSADGVSCNAQGVFIGHVPLLEKVDGRWMPRRAAELSDDLKACYRLPVDVTAKSNALSLIAAALNRGDLAMAAIAAVQMQLPDPPGLATGRESPDAVVRRARELAVSGLLKVWEPEEHPRTGTPPNPGWFAPIDGFEEQDIRVAVNPGPNNPWNEFPDAEGGGGGDPPSWSGSQNPDIPSSTPNSEGGGDGDASTPRSSNPESPLLFPGGLPPQLAPFTGGKTSGILQTSTDEILLQSGTQGPAADMPPGSLGFDGYTKTHVEGHAAAFMWQNRIDDATLFINNPEICDSCMSLLSRMLPPGATLRVILPNGTVMEFKGISR